MTYNVVRKVSRSSSIANPPFPRSDLSMDSPWPLPLLLQLHPFNMHQASNTQHPARDKTNRIAAARAVASAVVFREAHMKKRGSCRSLLPVAAIALLLAGCRGGGAEAVGTAARPLTMFFVPSVNSEQLAI